ncbi:MAG TPA: PqqD family protein [Blastocatellia bacterium]|nr:PqqD family protein [Blastocatellia bacterium]
MMNIEKSSPTVFTPLEDGTAVLLNLNTLFYYSLNRTGAVLWQQIENGKAVTMDNLIRAVCERFDVDEASARRSIGEFLERLQQFKMIRIE